MSDQPCIVCGTFGHEVVVVRGVQVQACPHVPVDRPVMFAPLQKDETSPGFPRLDRHIDSLPIQRTFSIEGRWRVYFNRHGAEPLMWCISPDAGGFELAACNVQISATSSTVYRKKETADEDDGRPSAWIAVEGLLTVSLTGDVTIGALNDR